MNKNKKIVKNIIKKCCIKNCKSEKSTGFALFAVPKDDTLFRKWSNAVNYSGTILTKSSFVCEKHFLPDQIKKSLIFKDREGNILFKSTLNEFGLEEGSVPSIFENVQIYECNEQGVLYQAQGVSKDGKTEIRQTFFEPNIDYMTNNNAFDHFLSSATSDNVTQKQTVKIPQQSKKPDNLDIVIEEVVNNCCPNEPDSSHAKSVQVSKNEKIIEHKYETKVQNLAKSEFGDFHNLESQEQALDRNFVNSISTRPFNMLFNNTKDIELPTSLWGCHKSSGSEDIIVFSKVKWFECEFETAPVYEMQLVFYKSNVIKLFVYDLLCNIEIECPMSIEELESILQQADNLKLCEGGPSVDLYPEYYSQSAFKDVASNWRHKQCTLVISDGSFCEMCETIYISIKILTSSPPSKKKRTKSKPENEKKIKATERIQRLKSEISEMQEEIIRLTNELE